MEMKLCIKCGQEKQVDDFYKSKQKKDGYTTYCKCCIKGISNQYRKDNKDYGKKYYEENKEKLKEQTLQHYYDNKEHYKEYYKEYRNNNKEYFKEYGKKYREKLKKNKELNKLEL